MTEPPPGTLPDANPAATITVESSGERVRGVTAADATTLQLPDGRRVRLLGVVAPEAGGCHAVEAKKHTDEMLRSPVLELTYPPDAGTDEFGQRWVYARYGYEGTGARLRDMGLELSAKGWVAPLPVSPDPPEYEAKIVNNVMFAQRNFWGRFDARGECTRLKLEPITLPPPPKLPKLKPLKVPKLDDN
jgi:hypothetical protein